jgi:hypothetical protein
VVNEQRMRHMPRSWREALGTIFVGALSGAAGAGIILLASVDRSAAPLPITTEGADPGPTSRPARATAPARATRAAPPDAARDVALSERIDALEVKYQLLMLKLTLAGRSPELAEARLPILTFSPDATSEGLSFTERLVQSGVDRAEAEALTAETERRQIEALRLQHQAEREGWSASELREARLELERERRSKLGEAAYDRLLFAEGRGNRVVITDRLAGSAAAAADLRPDDVVVAYAGEPVYTRQQLRALTQSGDLGETVTIEVRRDGARVQAELPRGPIGVQMRPFAYDPRGRESLEDAMRSGQTPATQRSR